MQTIPHSTPSQNVSTQMGSRSASLFFVDVFVQTPVCSNVDVFVQTPVCSNVLHDAATELPLTEFFIGCICSNDPLDRQNFVRQCPPSVQGPRALLQPPPRLEQPAPPPELAAYSHLLAAASARRSASTALAGTHYRVGSDPFTRTGPFPKPRALVYPMVKFGQPKSDRLGHIDTVDSDLMHHQFRLSFLQ